MFELIQDTYRHLALKYSIKSYMQWPTCVHSDDTSGHEPGLYHHRLVIYVAMELIQGWYHTYKTHIDILL